MSNNAAGRLPADLTPRERAALELLARGCSNEGIADEMALNRKTVEGLVRSVFVKLGLGAASAKENRRVLAARAFLADARPAALGPRLPGDVRVLTASAPFDSLASALEHCAPDGAEQQWMLRAAAAWYATIHEDFTRAARLARSAREATLRSPLGRVVTDAMVGVIDSFCGLAPVPHDRLDELSTALNQRGHLDGDKAHVVALVEVPNWFTFADRFGDAATIIGRYIDHDRLDAQDQLGLLCCQVELDLRRGRWDQAESSLVAVHELSRLSGSSTGYADALGARLQAMRGDGAAVAAHLAASRAAGMDRGDLSTLWRADAAECALSLGAGQNRAAASLAGSLHIARTRSGLKLPSVRWWDLDAMDAFRRSGRADLAGALLEELAVDVDLTDSRSGAAMLAAGRGMLAADGAERYLARAIELFREIGAPFEVARVQLMLAETIAGIDPDAAIDAAGRSLTVFESLRSVRWTAAARAVRGALSGD